MISNAFGSVGDLFVLLCLTNSTCLPSVTRCWHSVRNGRKEGYSWLEMVRRNSVIPDIASITCSCFISKAIFHRGQWRLKVYFKV